MKELCGMFFTQKVADALKAPLWVVAESYRIVAYKRLLDRYIEMWVMEGYGSCTGRQDLF